MTIAQSPTDIACPQCHASQGQRCVTASGRPARESHAQRVMASPLKLDLHPSVVERQKEIQALRRAARKGKYKLRCSAYVWCDHHCEVHVAEVDHYDEGAEDCNSDNWRRVYVASDDKKETF